MKSSSSKKAVFGLRLCAATLLIAAVNANAQESISSALHGFIENKGQIHDQSNVCNADVLFLHSSAGLNVDLRKNGFSYDTWKLNVDPAKPEDPTYHKLHQAYDDKTTVNFHRIDVTLIGANPDPEIQTAGRSESFANYYTAGTPEAGVTDVHSYSSVTYKNIYPQIDMEFVSSGKDFKYNFIVRPGGEISSIKMKYSGQEHISLKNGKLILKTSNGIMEENIPVSFLETDHAIVNVEYVLTYSNDGQTFVSFNSGKYNLKETLVIDPMPYLVWGTYYGGSASETLYDVQLEYFCGSTLSTSNIATAGSAQVTIGGLRDAVIGRFSPVGGTLQFATYMGGTQNDEAFALSVSTVNSPGVYVTGVTNSTTNIATAGAYDVTYDAAGDAFIACYNLTTGMRNFGTYYGGAGADQGNGIAASWYSAMPAIVICGTTASSSGTIIATAGSHQAVYGGGSNDGFIASLNNTGTSRNYGTYIGGAAADQLNDCAYANTMSSNIAFCGITSSTGYVTTGGSVDNSYNGGASDGLVGKINPTTGVMDWCGFSGGPSNDILLVIDYEGSGSNGIRVGGATSSTSGIWQSGGFQSTYAGGLYDGMLKTFDVLFGSTSSGTYYGGPGDEFITGVLTGLGSNTFGDNWGVTFTGWTTSTSGIATAGTHDPTANGNTDGFVAQLIQSPSVRVFGTYYGGSGNDYPNGIAFNSSGSYIIAGQTQSTSGISTALSHQPVYGGGAEDAFIARLDGCNGTGNASGLVASASQTSICAGGSVTLSVSSGNLNGANNYYWYAGSCASTVIDSGASITVSPTVTTTYYVNKRTWWSTPSYCSNFACGTPVTITVNSVTVNASASSATICSGSSTTLTASGASTYSWMPGSLNGSSVSVSPGANTTYTVTGTGANGCTSTSTVSVTVNNSPTVTATSSTVTVCSGSSVTLNGSGASTYNWQPGNIAGSSVTVNPASNTTYTVTGTAVNGCTGTATRSITVLTTPTVTANASSAICSGNSTTLSASGASTYLWLPGSLSGSSVTVSPSNTTTYSVTGTAANGCTAQATTTITVNQLPTVTAATSATQICDGSSVVLTAGGATNYSWQPGSLSGSPLTIVPAASTTYTVTGTDANGCSNTATTAVTVYPVPNVTATYSPSGNSCEGETFTLDASGAANYTWLPGNLNGVQIIQVLNVSETYTIVGTDNNGCSDSTTLFVLVFPNPVVVANASDTGVCTGTSVTLYGSGAMPGSYVWDNGVTDNIPFVPASTLTYNVYGTDANGCVGAASVTVNVSPMPDTGVTIAFDQITLNANQSGATYQWINCSTGLPINGANSQSYMATSNGSYAVIVNLGGCPDTSGCHAIQSVGLPDIHNQDLNIYPNPVTHTLFISGAAANNPIVVYNTLGEIVLSVAAQPGVTEIDFSMFSPGVYSVHVTGDSPHQIIHTR
jgi:hypothetical protein